MAAWVCWEEKGCCLPIPFLCPEEPRANSGKRHRGFQQHSWGASDGLFSPWEAPPCFHGIKLKARLHGKAEAAGSGQPRCRHLAAGRALAWVAEQSHVNPWKESRAAWDGRAVRQLLRGGAGGSGPRVGSGAWGGWRTVALGLGWALGLGEDGRWWLWARGGLWGLGRMVTFAIDIVSAFLFLCF